MKALASLVGHLSASSGWNTFGHTPACLLKFNVRRIMFLRVPNESIVDLHVSFMLPEVSYVVKRITMRLECFLALWNLGDLVSWNLRDLGSLFSLASLIFPIVASKRSRRGVQLHYPTVSGRVMTVSVISIFYVSVRPRTTVVAVTTVVASGSPGPWSHRLAIWVWVAQELQIVCNTHCELIWKEKLYTISTHTVHWSDY